MKKKYKIYVPLISRNCKGFWKMELIRDLLFAGYIVYRLKHYSMRLGKGTLYIGTTYYLKRRSDYEAD